MEALRKQLSEAEGHLQDRDKKYRELNAKFKTSTREWTNHSLELESRVRNLERQNEELREQRNLEPQTGHKVSSTTVALDAMVADSVLQQPSSAHASRSTSPGDDAGKGNVIVITSEQRRRMEEKYQMVKDKLAESEKKTARLEMQLCEQQRARQQPQKQQAISEVVQSDMPESEQTKDETKELASSALNDLAKDGVLRDGSERVTARHAATCFQSLREAIWKISRVYFNEARDLEKAPVPQQHAAILKKLSPSWECFLSDQGYSSYLFRALIWRYLDEFLFKKPDSIWGESVRQAMAHIASKMRDKDEAIQWRVGTAEILHTTSYYDTQTLEHLAQQIIGSIEWYLTDKDDKPSMAKSVAGIVTLGAQLSSIICRSSFGIMMSLYPGGDMIHGFEPAHKTMEVRHRLRGKEVVDLMVTPCLIAGDAKMYTVLEKAEVMC
ncbi:hypothetical protein Micbo1qcDRAFT_52678 [Microdochium bolleyi]|uniref:Uncharacterized protein n=1 Tax=Microdochium bolleyi TaxID=196109 RepID=A0A136J753_9PEZI|nr:hypothetical protein Micbo1qcDRAFT_52678 [Microdochium bolleyi]